MSIIDTLITDRTAQDVLDLKILISSKETLEDFDLAKHKGAYNFTDYNRTLDAIRYISERLYAIGCFPRILGTDAHMLYTSIPTVESTAPLVQSLKALLESLPKGSMITPPSTLKFLTYSQANDIEQILVDLDSSISRVEQSWLYSNDIYLGDI